MTALAIAYAAVLGAVIGSFLNVVVHRVPKRESLVRPRSRCGACEAPVAPRDNLPVVSWLLLRGRCRHCGARISPRYPAIELGTAALFAGIVAVRGLHPDLALWLPFAAVLVAVAAIDLEHRIIPNRILLPAAAWALGAGLLVRQGEVAELLIAGAAAFVLFLLAALAYPAGMGMGDVKLAGVLGLFLGREVGVALFAALILGSVVGALIIARKGAKEGRKTAVPFGPFLALGGVLALFVGDPIVDWYLNRF